MATSLGAFYARNSDLVYISENSRTPLWGVWENGEKRLSRADPRGPRLRRGGGDAARSRAESLGAARQPGAAEARGHAAGVLVQVPRRVQQDGEPAARRALARGDRLLGRQPRPGRGARRAKARLRRDD